MGGIRQTTSPGTPSGCRLVATTRTPRQERRSSSARRAHPPTRCSQLSSAISTDRSPRRCPRVTGGSAAGPMTTPSAIAATSAIRAGSSTAARSTHALRSDPRPARRRSVSRARRVLPLPPGPTRVTSRCAASSSPTSRSSRWRPTNDDSSTIDHGTGDPLGRPSDRARSVLFDPRSLVRPEGALVIQPARSPPRAASTGAAAVVPRVAVTGRRSRTGRVR